MHSSNKKVALIPNDRSCSPLEEQYQGDDGR